MDDFAGMDDATAELFLAGRAADVEGRDAGAAAVAEFVAELQATALLRPAPVSPALAVVLRDGLPTPPALVQVTAPPHRRLEPSRTRRRRVLTTIGVGFGVATSGVTVAAAANLLPAGPQSMVGSVVRVLTPFELATRSPARGNSTSAEWQKGAHGTVAGGGPEQSGRAGPGGATTGDPSAGVVTARTTSPRPGSSSASEGPGSLEPFPSLPTGSIPGPSGGGNAEDPLSNSPTGPFPTVPSMDVPSPTVPTTPTTSPPPAITSGPRTSPAVPGPG